MVALALVAGCASSLQTHARIAQVTAVLVDDAGAAIEREARRDVGAIPVGSTEDERARHLATLRQHYAPIEAAYAQLRDAQLAYVGAISRALADDSDVLQCDCSHLLVTAWKRVAMLADDAGVPLPPIPPAVRALLSEDRGQ